MPVFALALSAIGAIVVIKLINREWRRVNDELDRIKPVRVTEAERAGIGDRRDELCAPDPLHAALDDGVFDPEQLRETRIQHGYDFPACARKAARSSFLRILPGPVSGSGSSRNVTPRGHL